MKNILIVEDDAATVELLRHFLESKGLSVETARDGLDGLEKLRKGTTPDLVVLDVMMPKLDGYSFLRELKQDAKLRTLPVIVLSAREMMRDLFEQEGVKDFVLKPYDPAELYKVIQKYL